MSGPTTNAGRALLGFPFQYHTPDCDVTAEDNCTCDLAEHIAAIEREARAPLVEALRGLMGHGGYVSVCRCVSHEDARALLAEYDK